MLPTLKKRAEFLRIRGGARWATPAFVMETKPREPGAGGDDGEARFGFTVTKQLGNAVVRNRIRRRLREAVSKAANGRARPGHDYVLIARADARTMEFAGLVTALEAAFDRVHRGGKSRTPR